jgi:hypothetical protein
MVNERNVGLRNLRLFSTHSLCGAWDWSFDHELQSERPEIAIGALDHSNRPCVLWSYPYLHRRLRGQSPARPDCFVWAVRRCSWNNCLHIRGLDQSANRGGIEKGARAGELLGTNATLCFDLLHQLSVPLSLALLY